LALDIVCTVQSMIDQGWRSIGLIAKNAEQAIEMYLLLGDSVKSTLVTKEEDDFHHGVVIIPSYLAKGLEFDAVLVLNADSINYSHAQDRHILYTICTRSLHRLYLYYMDTPSPFIAEISKDLYQIPNL
ncbi:MAG: helD 1, partial [Sporomusa sp.]|nr:helD 1 [Sporomusa sp.]